MAHGDIAVVAAEEDLVAGGDYLPVGSDAGVDRGLGAALAYGLDLRDGVGQLHEPLRAGEHVREEVRAQAETEHGEVELVHHLAQAVYLLGREKLRLVGDDDVKSARGLVPGADVILGENDGGVAGEADAAFHYVGAVAVVHTGLYQPDRHAQLLVVELGYQRLGALRRAHGAVFEIEFSHFVPPLRVHLCAR